MERTSQSTRQQIKQRHFSLTVFKVYLSKLCEARSRRDELLHHSMRSNPSLSERQTHIEVFYEPIVIRQRAKSSVASRMQRQADASGNLMRAKKAAFERAMRGFNENRDRINRKKAELLSLKFD